MLAAGVVVFGLFALFEARRERAGSTRWSRRACSASARSPAASLVGLVFFAALIGTGLVFTLYLQIGLGYSPLKAGLAGCRRRSARSPASSPPEPAWPRSWAASCCSSARLVMWSARRVRADRAAWPARRSASWRCPGAGCWSASAWAWRMAPFFDIVLAGVDDQETGSAVRRAHLGAAARRRVRHRRPGHGLLPHPRRLSRRRHAGSAAFRDAAWDCRCGSAPGWSCSPSLLTFLLPLKARADDAFAGRAVRPATAERVETR